MFLSNFSIRRPVSATMMSVALVVFGLIGYFRLPVRELPDVDPPVVSIITVYPGASPEIVEREVTKVLEEELNTIDGIRTMTSSSKEQVSSITIEFSLTRPVDVAAQDVRDKISRIRKTLPDDIDPPVVAKQEADASPIIWVALNSSTLSPLDLTDIAENFYKDRLQNVEGVGQVIIGGAQRFSVRVRLDAHKLAAHQITVGDVSTALQTQNLELPSGRVESKSREFTINTEGQFKTPEQFNELVIAWRNGAPIRLKDVGFAEAGVEDERTVARFKGKPAVGLGVVKQSKANTVAVADKVKELLAKLEPVKPAGVEATIAYDSSIFVSRSIKEVKETLILASALVTLVIFIFLRSIRTTLIPALAIPTSIIFTFAVINWLGFTINNLTLLALVLCIGIVVDDAIVVLENAFRHIEEYGKTPLQAAKEATTEVGFAVIATTLSLIAVFIPVAFLTGTTGRLFYELGVTVAVAVGISCFVSLTLTPMLCSRYLRHQSKHNWMYNVLESFFNGMSNGYRALLGFVLKARLLMLIVGAASMFAIYYFGGLLKRELLPVEDKGSFLVLTIAPEGSTLEYTDKYQKQAEAVIAGIPEVDRYFSAVGLAIEGVGQPDTGIMFARMIPWEQRKRSQSDIVHSIFGPLMGIPGLLAIPIEPPPLSSAGFDQKLLMMVQGDDLTELSNFSNELVGKMRAMPNIFTDPKSDLKVSKPELRVTIDRNKAADLGVSVRDIASSLQVLFGGQDVVKFKRGGDQFKVMVQLERGSRITPSDVGSIYVRTTSGSLVSLGNIVTIKEGVGPSNISHYDRLRAAKIGANLAPGITLGEAITALQKLSKETLPPSYGTAFAGESREFLEGQGGLLFTFMLALLMTYMILASQFESFSHPFTVMLAVPLAVAGALATLYVCNMTLNIYSMIGLVMLIGLSAKNSILLVDFANQARASGLPLFEATIRAGAVRLRPILMTAISTIIGAVPIAFGLGAGSVSRKPLGMAVVGGMAISTLLTLFLIPVVYTLVVQLTDKSTRRK